MGACVFVWGVPLSGQRYWMSQAALDVPEGHRAILMPLESPTTPTESILQDLGRLLDDTAPLAPVQIYCELPWSATHEADTIHEWATARPEFKDHSANPWTMNFTALCPPDAERLPAFYRRGLEEFSRATHSSVVVTRREGDETELEWFDTELLDFGRRLELFEVDLWPASTLAETMTGTKHPIEIEELETLVLPVSGDRTSYADLFQDLAHGYYGPVWGAECCWKNARGELEALTLSQGSVFSWTSSQQQLLRSIPVNGALLSLAGGKFRREDLLLALRSQSFC